jgi:hypothetical protein
MAPEASPEDFAALVKDLRAELDEADKERKRRLLASPRLETPHSFAGRPWAWNVVNAKGAARVTGYAEASIRGLKARADKARAEGTADERAMPEPVNGKWVVGDLAVWVATKNEGQAAQIALTDEQAAEVLAAVEAARRPGRRLPNGLYAQLGAEYGVSESLIERLALGQVPATGRRGVLGARLERREAGLLPLVRAVHERDGQVTYRGLVAELGINMRTAMNLCAELGIESAAIQERASDDVVSAFLAGQLARAVRFVKSETLLEAAWDAGIPASSGQVAKLLPDVRAAEARRKHKPGGLERARGESLRADGLLLTVEVAEDWAVSGTSVVQARKRGDLRVAKWEKDRPLFDPRRLRARKDRRRTPVDVSHPMARLEPGDPGYEG